jgi:hypothetical protein
VTATTAANRTSGRRRNAVRIVLAAVVAALLVMWVYVLFIGKEKFPNHLQDATWPRAAEPVCAATTRAVAALPPAASFADIKPKEEALRQRADVGEQVTDLLRRQLQQLRTLPPPAGTNDELLLQAWFADWQAYLTDRQAHIDEWRAGRDRQFAETQVDGGPISDRMDALATQNDMADCVVPQDFG